MTLSPQVKVFAAGQALFGGTGLRRLTVNVGGQPCELLLHEGAKQTTPFLLAAEALGAAGPLTLLAEWGEPLGQVCALHTQEDTGQVMAYDLLLRGQTSPVTVQATDTYWWNGELLCRRRQAYALREQARGKKPRPRAQAA